MSPALPRWIDNEKVDSRAMLSSYLQYITQCEELCEDHGRPMPKFHLKLWDVIHKELYIPDAVSLECPLVSHRPCEKSPCRRCDERVGGYQFKWYSAVWARTYNRLRRDGSWKAPELTEQQRQSHIPGY